MYESIPFHSLNPEDIFQMGTIALPKATGLPIHGECGFEQSQEGQKACNLVFMILYNTPSCLSSPRLLPQIQDAFHASLHRSKFTLISPPLPAAPCKTHTQRYTHGILYVSLHFNRLFLTWFLSIQFSHILLALPSGAQYNDSYFVLVSLYLGPCVMSAIPSPHQDWILPVGRDLIFFCLWIFPLLPEHKVVISGWTDIHIIR